MAIDDVDVSGPEGNAVPQEKGGLTAALNNAFSAFDDEGDVPLFKAAKVKADRDPSPSKAGGDADEGEAGKDPATPDPASPPATAKAAAPDGNAAIEPPNHWTAERKQTFQALPPEAKKAVLGLAKDLESGFTKRSMELSDSAKFADAVRGLLSDDTSKAQLSQAGLDEVGYVRYLHSLQRFATTDPASYLKWAMQSLGVRPEHLGFGTDAPRAAAPNGQQAHQTGDPALDDLLADPALKELRQELGTLKQSNQAMQQYFQQQAQEAQAQQQRHQQSRQQAISTMWTDFRSSIDDHGQLAFPHADTVMRQMGAIMETDPEISRLADGPDKLKAAYDAAIWATPGFRSQRLEAEKAAAQAAADKAREAERAKRAVGPKQAKGAPTVPAKRGGINAALEGAFAVHGIE